MENAFKATSCSVSTCGISHGMKHTQCPKASTASDKPICIGTEQALGAQGKVMEVAVGGAVGTELWPLSCRELRDTASASLPAKGCWSSAHQHTWGLKTRRLGRGKLAHRNSKQLQL